MVAGIVLFALGLKTTLDHVDEELHTVPAVALCGRVALYLLAHIAFPFERSAAYSAGAPPARSSTRNDPKPTSAGSWSCSSKKT